MSVYLRNYWNLFRDFTEEFRELIYKRIPLPLLTNFYKYLPDEIRENMRKPDFRQHLQMKIRRAEDIHAAFEIFTTPLKKPTVFGIRGVTLVNADYVRFRSENFMQCFDRQKTILIGRGGPQELHSLPLYNINDYSSNVTGVVKRIEQKAMRLFAVRRKHPVFGHHRFRSAFLHDLPTMMQYLTAASRLFDKLPVSSVVVGTTEDLLSRILVLTAAGRGIPSLCLQHGLIMGEEAYLPVFATRMGVYGPYELDWYSKHGVPRSRLLITGHPRYDIVRCQYPIPRMNLLGGIGLNGSGKVRTVLVATQPGGGPERWLRLIQRLSGLYAFQVIVKPHPLEISRGTTAAYKTVYKAFPTVRVIEGNIQLNDWIAAVDAVIVETSTVGLEGMLHSKPVFVLEGRQIDREYDYYDRLGPHVSSDPIELADRIRTVLGSGGKSAIAREVRRRFLKGAYPLALSAPVIAKLIAGWNGNSAVAWFQAFEGRLIRGHREEVYVIEHGMKRHVAGLDVFKASNFNWEHVCFVDDRIVNRIPTAAAITGGYKPPRNRTNPRGARIDLNDILVKGSGEEVYRLARGLKHHISSLQVFSRMKLDWSHVCRLDDRILCSIPSGPFYE